MNPMHPTMQNIHLTRMPAAMLTQENPDAKRAVVITGQNNGHNHVLAAKYQTKSGDIITIWGKDGAYRNDDEVIDLEAEAAEVIGKDDAFEALPEYVATAAKTADWAEHKLPDDAEHNANYSKPDPTRETGETRIVHLSLSHISAETTALLNDCTPFGISPRAQNVDSRLEDNGIKISRLTNMEHNGKLLVDFSDAIGATVRGPEDLVDCIAWAAGLGYHAILFTPVEGGINVTSALPSYDN